MEPDVLDHLYTVTKGNHTDYINPTTDGLVSFGSIQSVEEDSVDYFNNWK
jgi:hypothetical protein